MKSEKTENSSKAAPTQQGKSSMKPSRGVTEDGSLYQEILRDSQVMDDFRRTEMSQTSMASLGERLDAIRAAAKDGKMLSYGSSKDFTLKRLQQLRKSQIHIFKRHMELELSFPNLEQNEDFSSKEFSERFQEKFYEKENEISSIAGTLEGLTRLLGQVNEDSSSNNLARDPCLDTTGDNGIPGRTGFGKLHPPGRMILSFNGEHPPKGLRVNQSNGFRQHYEPNSDRRTRDEEIDSWMNQLDLEGGRYNKGSDVSEMQSESGSPKQPQESSHGPASNNGKPAQ